MQLTSHFYDFSMIYYAFYNTTAQSCQNQLNSTIYVAVFTYLNFKFTFSSLKMNCSSFCYLSKDTNLISIRFFFNFLRIFKNRDATIHFHDQFTPIIHYSDQFSCISISSSYFYFIITLTL